ncbi:MAG: hypothetical protein GXP38_09845, partial [Chloroflexi bacterium]|nr:hypothetical protein [Chloroflexota bacterium]
HYFKYGGEAGDPDPHWYDFTYDGDTGAEIEGDTIILHLRDGGRGDNDLLVNGRILDPGGPARPPSTTPPPTTTPSHLSATRKNSSIIVQWQTEAGGETIGFVVWRATSRSGPFQSVSKRLPAAADPDGARYQWKDTDVGTATYWYLLETLSDGRRYGPVQAEGSYEYRLFLPHVGM